MESTLTHDREIDAREIEFPQVAERLTARVVPVGAQPPLPHLRTCRTEPPAVIRDAAPRCRTA